MGEPRFIGQNFQSITVKMAAWRVWQKDAGTGV